MYTIHKKRCSSLGNTRRRVASSRPEKGRGQRDCITRPGAMYVVYVISPALCPTSENLVLTACIHPPSPAFFGADG